jgi:hypothetical protein
MVVTSYFRYLLVTGKKWEISPEMQAFLQWKELCDIKHPNLKVIYTPNRGHSMVAQEFISVGSLVQVQQLNPF